MRSCSKWTRHAHAATKELERRPSERDRLPRRWQPVFSLPAEFILIYCVAAKEMYCCDVPRESSAHVRLREREGEERDDRSDRKEKEFEKLVIFLRWFCGKISKIPVDILNKFQYICISNYFTLLKREGNISSIKNILSNKDWFISYDNVTWDENILP